jgi:hypothetical protein
MERLKLGSFGAGESESAGNTVGPAGGPRAAMTSPGGDSILPASPTRDVLLDLTGGAVRDFGRFIGDGGQADSRPVQGGPFRSAGGYDAPDGVWREQ